MGISILIVDDDKLLVEKLEETVNWSGIGIDMVFTANNIRQAQKLLEEYPIEMLLCDIDMPQGNGLELLEWIRYKKLDIECTFLSSYANFAYAQMALKLSSREYLLKPISNADLETALRRIVGIVQEKLQEYLRKREKSGGLRKDFTSRFFEEMIQNIYVYLKESNIVFGQIFDSEEYETKRREAVLSVVGAHAFIDYLFDVLEGQKKNESRSDNVVEQLKDYIEQNLNEDLSRSVLAGKVFLSEDYVSKIFMKTTGMSLPNYIAERRIERAKEYLRSSSLPISKIAMEVGYGNFSYFSKTFRELVGCTPNEYRSRQK